MLEKRDAMSTFSFHLYLHFKFPSSAHRSFICIHPSEVFYEACKNGVNILDERIVCNIFSILFRQFFFSIIMKGKVFRFYYLQRGSIASATRDLFVFSCGLLFRLKYPFAPLEYFIEEWSLLRVLLIELLFLSFPIFSFLFLSLYLFVIMLKEVSSS